MSKVAASSADMKPSARATDDAEGPATDAIRLFLAAPNGPGNDELAKFRSMAEVKSGFEEMQRNLQGAAADPATFEKYKEGWNSICDLLEEVRTLRLRTVELEAENDIILDLVDEVASLKCEITRLEEENKSLAQDNVQLRDNLNSKLSAIDSWIRVERSRVRAEALAKSHAGAEDESQSVEDGNDAMDTTPM